MLISFSSFFASSIAVALLTFVFLFLLQKRQFVSYFGLGCVYLLGFLALLRGLLPMEIKYFPFPLTKTVFSDRLLPFFRDLLLYPLFSTNSFYITPASALITIWLMGSVIFLFKRIHGYYLCKKLIKCLPQITDPEVLNIFCNVQKFFYPKRAVSFRLVCSGHFSSPATCGIYHPIIVLPDVNYTPEELYYVFAHELLHHKHKDFILQALINILTIVQWWNPVLTYFLSPAFHQVQELLVDYHLTKNLNHAQRTVYLETLSKTLHYAQSSKPLSNSQTYTFVNSHKKATAFQRLQYIANIPAKTLSVQGIILCFLLFLSSFLFVFEPSYPVKTDELGEEIFQDRQGLTYYIRNGDCYDLYMENQYVCTTSEILETFKHVPIYNNIEEVL